MKCSSPMMPNGRCLISWRRRHMFVNASDFQKGCGTPSLALLYCQKLAFPQFNITNGTTSRVWGNLPRLLNYCTRKLLTLPKQELRSVITEILFIHNAGSRHVMQFNLSPVIKRSERVKSVIKGRFTTYIKHFSLFFHLHSHILHELNV